MLWLRSQVGGSTPVLFWGRMLTFCTPVCMGGCCMSGCCFGVYCGGFGRGLVRVLIGCGSGCCGICRMFQVLLVSYVVGEWAMLGLEAFLRLMTSVWIYGLPILLLCAVPSLVVEFALFGGGPSLTGLAYSRIGRTRVLYEISFIFLFPILRLRLRNPRVWFALLLVCSICVFQAKFPWMVIPKYLVFVTFSRGWFRML